MNSYVLVFTIFNLTRISLLLLWYGYICFNWAFCGIICVRRVIEHFGRSCLFLYRHVGGFTSEDPDSNTSTNDEGDDVGDDNSEHEFGVALGSTEHLETSLAGLGRGGGS